ncbi:LptF/LptG family permease [Criblamydia sequanensis]|uniref:Permease, YjgP/YjgQ family n=1 Tax=Candidatus Criblamydia sequanensis CRIB-18 TaxID=1437425 RepID=A0A090CYD4_9BACT|nr:LptF/LptG family permease [Criblamydia sequanensis]CDR33331.1 Permease, YjgP/YjgQ family [Criblamydia sequanensis CRIB-18]
MTVLPLRIFERYFFKEFCKTFFFILSAVFFLFMVIDFSSRTAMHHQHGMRFDVLEIFWYYFYEFSLEVKILVPFSALVATIKVVSELSSHGELTALLTSGMRLKRVLRPFVIMGLLLSLLTIANEEYIVPKANRYINRMIHFKKKEGKKRKSQTHIQTIPLDGGDERLLYTHYEENSQRFFDVVWLKSFDEYYRIKYLYPFQSPPLAKEVEVIKRDEKGRFSVFESFDELAILDLYLEKERLTQTIMKPEEFSLSELLKKTPPFFSECKEKECQLQTVLLLKLFLPWLTLLVILGALPSLIFFSRGKALYRIYAGALFTFFFMYLFLEAASVLAKKQVLEPELALGIPFSFFLSFILFRYYKLR